MRDERGKRFQVMEEVSVVTVVDKVLNVLTLYHPQPKLPVG